MNLIFCITFCFRFKKDLFIELNSITNRGMHIYNFTLETPSRHLAVEELLISLADPIVVNLFHSFGRRHGILNPALLSGL